MSFTYERPDLFLSGPIDLDNAGTDALLRRIGDDRDLNLFVDSEGGNAVPAFKIHNALKGRTRHCEIVGRCHSAAVIVALAADTIEIRTGAKMMTHRSSTCVLGNVDDLEFEARHLAEIDALLVDVVRERTGQPLETVKGWFSGCDRYFTAEESVAVGLADAVVDEPVNWKELCGEPPAPGPADDGKGALLLELLNALGPIRTADKDRLRRSVNAWFSVNIL